MTKRVIAVLAVLAAGFLVGADAAGAERIWVLQTGFGVAGARGIGSGDGRALSVGLAAPLRSWFLVGAQVTAIRYLATSGESEFSSRLDYGKADVIAVMATFRFQPPVSSGPAPFLVAESGLGYVNPGGRTYHYLYAPAPASYAGLQQLGFCSGAALGLRVVTPGRFPDPEASVRYTAFAGTHFAEAGELRLALGW